MAYDDEDEDQVERVKARWKAWSDGAIARASDKRADANPFPDDGGRHDDWYDGWHSIDQAIRNRIDMAKY